VACGIIEPLHGETVDVGVYPGTSVPLSYALTRGLLHVTEEGDAATNFVRPSSSSFNVRGSVRIVTQGGSTQATQLMSVSLRGADPACASGPGSAAGSCGITLNLETSCAGTSFTPLPGALGGRAAPAAPAPSLGKAAASTTVSPGVSAYAPGSSEIQATAEASPAFLSYIADAKVSGVFQGEPSRAFINGRLARSGTVIEEVLGNTFLGVDSDNRMLLFKDRNGARVTKRY
jgi:hypothetical protein